MNLKRGVERLYGAEVYSTDLRASASLVLAGLVAGFITGGDIVLEDLRVEHLGSVMEKLREAGADLEILSLDRVRVKGGKDITPLSISTMAYTGYPTDMQAQFMVLCCLADGVSEIRENIFENRFQHVAELQRYIIWCFSSLFIIIFTTSPFLE